MKLRRDRPDAYALARSLTHVRIIVGLVGAALSAWMLQRELAPGALAGVIGGGVVIVSALAERWLGNRFSRRSVSMLVSAIDVAVVLVVLALHGTEVGDPAAMLLMLPLIAAGVRHGVFGVVVVWSVFSMALFGELAVTWTGAPDEVQAPTKFALMLLVVALPAARFTEHLAQRLHLVATAQTAADERADLLITVLETSSALAAGEDRESTIVAGAARLAPGRYVVTTDDEPSTVETNDGDVITVAIGDGSLRGQFVDAPSARAVEALELLCAIVSKLPSSPAAPASASLGRPVSDLTTRAERSGRVLDRPGINRHVDDVLAHHQVVSLAVVSLDNLKLLNDLYGRDVGDKLIRATAGRLVDLATTLDGCVGWLGGDDFTVVVAGEVPDLAESIALTLTGPVDIGRFGSTSIHAGVGVAHAVADDTGPQLTRRATEQMYADRREKNQTFLDDAADQFERVWP